jgi:hypothetical protein
MKLSDWFRARSLQEILMIVVIVLLLSMIATRWRYIGDTVSEAFRRRFVPPQEVPSQETPTLETPIQEKNPTHESASQNDPMPEEIPAHEAASLNIPEPGANATYEPTSQDAEPAAGPTDLSRRDSHATDSLKGETLSDRIPE